MFLIFRHFSAFFKRLARSLRFCFPPFHLPNSKTLVLSIANGPFSSTQEERLLVELDGEQDSFRKSSIESKIDNT